MFLQRTQSHLIPHQRVICQCPATHQRMVSSVSDYCATASFTSKKISSGIPRLCCHACCSPPLGKIDAQFSSTVKYWFLTSTKRSSSLGFPVVMQRIQSGFFSLLEMFFNPTQETEGIFNWSSIPNIEDQSSDHLCVSLLYFLQTLWHLHSCRHQRVV